MNYDELRALFHSFVLQPSNSLLSFSMSQDVRTLSTQPEQVYPQLQLDVPSWTPTLTPGQKSKKVISTQVAIVSPIFQDHWADQDALMDTLEIEMERLISYVDTKRRLLSWGTIDSIGTVVPIEFAEHASLFGWAVPISFSVNMPCYHNPENTYTIVHLNPAFESSETQLSIDVGGTQYDASWDDELIPPDRPIDVLVAAINVDTLTHLVTARRHLNTLILSISTPNTNVPWAAVAGNHSWTSITI